jgi:hypothetical protein
VEIDMPLDDESADGETVGKERPARSAKPLLLDALDLDDQAILDDQPDLAEPDAPDGLANLVQIEVAGG